MKCPGWLFFTSQIHLRDCRCRGSSPQSVHGTRSCVCPPLWSEESPGVRCFLLLLLWLFWIPGLPACGPHIQITGEKQLQRIPNPSCGAEVTAPGASCNRLLCSLRSPLQFKTHLRFKVLFISNQQKTTSSIGDHNNYLIYPMRGDISMEQI